MQVESVPEPRELLDTVVNMEAPTAGAPFRTHHDFFGAGGTDTIVVLTLGARESLLTGEDSDRVDQPAGIAAPPDGPRFEAIARLVGDDPEGRTYDLAGVTALRSGAGDLALDDDGYRLFQGGATITPGTYTIHFGVVDLHSGRIHSFRDRIEVPAYDSDRIAVSSITLASRLERLPGRTTFGYSAPFVFGDLRAVPRADDILDGDDELLIYYQVYGAAIDAIGGRPDFDLEYRVLAALSAGPDGAPIFSPFGHPIQLTHLHNPVQGYSFALAGWPPAAYLLEVEALDNYTGLRSSSRVTFLIR
jgi:hypothetical protein